MRRSIQGAYRVLTILLIGIVVMSAIPLYPVEAATFAGGDGSPQSPYLIENAEQFNAIRNDLYASYKLTRNIDLSVYASEEGGRGWRPIEGQFVGRLDGDGFRITGLIIDRGDEAKVGLFQSIQFGQVRNLSIVQAQVAGNNQVGVLAGSIYEGTVEDVHVSGEVEGEDYVGGMLGEVSDSHIIGSGAVVEVNANGSYAGGLVGISSNSTVTSIINSYAEGNVRASSDYVGGLSGFLLRATVERSYASGNVAGGSSVGGLTGTALSATAILESYALGAVTGNVTVGGFVGYIYSASISDSYSLGAVTANDMSGGFGGYSYDETISRLYWNSDVHWGPFGFYSFTGDITGMPKSDFYTAASFGSLDFDHTWTIAEGGSYPYLRSNAPQWLTGLTVTPDAGVAGQLAPAWHVFVHDYRISVTGNVTSLAATPVVPNSDAVIDIVGMDGLVTGNNSATITVNDANGVRNPQVYRLNVQKLTSTTLSSDASLTDLRIDGSSIPEFDGDTLAYHAVVPQSSTSVTITAIPNDPDATYTVTGSDNLALGENTVTIMVIASDGTSRTYTITINRNRFAGGDGTEISPYLIANAGQFNEIRNDYQKSYRLIADIDLTPYGTVDGGQGWEPIYMEGKLDGNGHAITGLSINRPHEDVIGLFQYIYLGQVSNLEILGASVIGRDDVGILAGELNSDVVSNVRTTGTVSGQNQVGGLVGRFSYGIIRASSSAATVTGTGAAVGGLAGLSYAAIETSYAEGHVHGQTRVGGLAGVVEYGTINNSFAAGKVVAELASAGGLVGRSNQGSFTNIYATGSVQGGSTAGGLIGTRTISTFTRGYWNTSTTGLSAGVGSGTSTGVTGYTSQQMKSSASFNGWDFSNVWHIEPTTTPYLRGAPLPLWLSSLTVVDNSGANVVIAPALDNLTRSYTVAVAHDIHSVTVSGTAIDPSAVVSASGGTGLSVGYNLVSVTVTGSEGNNSREYALNVVRSDPSQAVLSGLTLSSGSLSPTFAEETREYSVNVPFTTTDIALTPYVGNIGSTVKVNDMEVPSGEMSGNIALAAGANTVIAVEVISQDGTNTRTYTVTVARAAGSSNANLSALTTTGGSLSPTFSSATTTYTAAGVSNGTSTITVRPTVADSTASLSVSVNGGTVVSVTSGQNSPALAVNVGSNTIVITVMAQDGTTKLYTVSVTRAASSVATLSNLTLSSGAFSPSFGANSSAYTAAVANSYSSVTVRPSASNANASISVTVNGGDPVAVNSGTDSASLQLNTGANTIQVIVLAQDGVATRTYTITVTRSQSSANDISSFSFAGLSPAVAGTINGTNIALIVPYGTDVSELVATFAHSDASTVTVGGAVQESDTTVKDYTSPVIYTVTAENGDTKEYTVTVSVAANTENDLTSFSFEGLMPAVTGTIIGTNIGLTVPYGTDVRELVATFAHSDASTVTVGGAVQESGTTANDYTSPVIYTVTAENGSTKEYTVTVAVAANTENDLTSFSFEGLTPTVTGTIIGTNIGLTVPYGTDVRELVATFAHSDASTVTVGGAVQESGTTANDYTSPVIYTVTAENGSTKEYTVTVAVAANTENDLTSFSFEGLTPPVTGTVNGTNIGLTVPYGTDVRELVATFAHSDASTVTVGGALQESGTTANDFTSPVIYTVTAENGSTKEYTVTVTIATNTENDLTSFSFEGLTPTVTGTIIGTNIGLTVPYGINVGALIATFTSSAAASVSVGGAAQTSGTTANDFTSPVVYSVTAESGSTKEYTVTVTIATNTENDLTSFSFEGLTPTVTGTIIGTNIGLTVPYGTNVGALVATFTSSAAASVSVGGAAQTSGTTANDFTSPVIYTVTAENGSTKEYTVTVAVAANTENDLTSFSFEGLTPAVTGTVNGTNIGLTVPYGTNVGALIATFTSSAAASVSVGGAAQTSGTTANDFTSPVIYTVTAENGSTKAYTVTVALAARPSTGGGIGIVDTKPTDVDEIVIKVGQSGVFHREREIRIAIPSGATDKDIIISVRKMIDTEELRSNGELLISPVYELLKNFSGNFLKNITIRLYFDSALLTINQKPSIFFYDEVQKVWIELGGTIDGNSITVEVNHFTKFAVLPVSKEPNEEASPELNDIESHWAASTIKQAVASGIVSGYADGTFRPNASITRAEFAVLLVRTLKLQGEGTELHFSDSHSIGSWAKREIALAVKEGIISGYSDGSFRPNAVITRAEMAVMIAKAQRLQLEANTTTQFADDADIPAWSKAAILAIAEQGIVQGRGGNRYAPMATASRAEAVVVLMKLVEMMG